MTRLIVTIAAGACIDYDDLSVPTMSAYAKRIGADLLVLRSPVFGEVIDATYGAPGCPAFWKIPLIDWFGRQELYDVMVYMDADIHVSSKAPDIFTGVQKDDPHFHMAQDMNPDTAPWWKWATESYPDIVNWGPPFQKPVVYHNSGVMLLTRAAAQRAGQFIPHDVYYSRYFEQDYLLLVGARIGGITALPKVFNQAIPWKHPLSDAKQGMWHTCGIQQEHKREWFLQFQAQDLWMRELP